jgi:hypothetical protein
MWETMKIKENDQTELAEGRKRDPHGTIKTGERRPVKSEQGCVPHSRAGV